MGYTLQQRDDFLVNKVYQYVQTLDTGSTNYIVDKLMEPLDVPGVGFIKITGYSNIEIHDANRLSKNLVPIWIYLEEWLKDSHDQNKQEIAIDSFDFDHATRWYADYGTHTMIKTRKAIQAILTAWIEKRITLETQTRIYTGSVYDQIEKVAGRIPVTDSEGTVLTGEAAITERERISSILQTSITTAGVRAAMENIVIPTGFSLNIDEACQQALEWLAAVAERKVNWIVNSQGHPVVEPASADQVTALKNVETERQKGMIAVQRGTTVSAITTAYNTAETAINAVIVNNTPIWKMNTGNTIPLTNGRHVITYATPFTAVSYRADNPIIDSEDTADMGDISIDKNGSPYFIFTRNTATGSITSSYSVTIDRNSTLPNPKSGNYDVDLTARNRCGPTLFKVRIVVPEYTLSFARSNLPAQTFRKKNPTSIQFDAATGGNGKITYSMDSTPGDMHFNPITRILKGKPHAATAATTYTYTATDEDGKTASQTISITISR